MKDGRQPLKTGDGQIVPADVGQLVQENPFQRLAPTRNRPDRPARSRPAEGLPRRRARPSRGFSTTFTRRRRPKRSHNSPKSMRSIQKRSTSFAPRSRRWNPPLHPQKPGEQEARDGRPSNHQSAEERKGRRVLGRRRGGWQRRSGRGGIVPGDDRFQRRIGHDRRTIVVADRFNRLPREKCRRLAATRCRQWLVRRVVLRRRRSGPCVLQYPRRHPPSDLFGHGNPPAARRA